MSYPRGLDEYSQEELLRELARRAEARERGKCDYCGYPRGVSIRRHLRWVGQPYEHATDGPCRFPDRHAGSVT